MSNPNVTCGLTAAGVAYCWGYGLEGQIGNGAFANVSVPTRISMPVGIVFNSISVAKAICALSSTGRVYCWGYGEWGQIGNGAFANVNTPTLVTMPANVTFRSVSSLYGYSCALSLTDTAYCWGGGEHGVLGNGSENNLNIPTAVTMPAGVTFRTIANNNDSNCALTQIGTVYCWGFGALGRLGDGLGYIHSVLVPTQVIMPLGITFTTLSTNSLTACALTVAGNAYCWGGFGYSNDHSEDLLVPTLEEAPEGVMFTKMSTNDTFIMAFTPDGKLYSWGHDWYGQLGIGVTSQDKFVPTAVVMD